MTKTNLVLYKKDHFHFLYNLWWEDPLHFEEEAAVLVHTVVITFTPATSISREMTRVQAAPYLLTSTRRGWKIKRKPFKGGYIVMGRLFGVCQLVVKVSLPTDVWSGFDIIFDSVR